MKNIIIIVKVTIMFSIYGFSQNIIPKIEWYRIYDGPKNSVDLTNDIRMDNLYNIYLCSRSVGLNGQIY